MKDIMMSMLEGVVLSLARAYRSLTPLPVATGPGSEANIAKENKVIALRPLRLNRYK